MPDARGQPRDAVAAALESPRAIARNRVLLFAIIILGVSAIVPLLGDVFFEGDGVEPLPKAFEINRILLYLHLISDVFIGLAYVAISATLIYFAKKARRDIPYLWAFVAFGVFIISCGLTHFMAAVTLWEPVLWLAGGIKYVTAISSVGTAIAIPPLVPKILQMVQSEEVTEQQRRELEERQHLLQDRNAQLEHEIVQRIQAEEATRVSLRRFEVLVEQLPMGALVTDVDDTIIQANDAFCQFIKPDASPAQLLGVRREALMVSIAHDVENAAQFLRDTHEMTVCTQPVRDHELLFQDGRTISRDMFTIIVDGTLRGRLYLYYDITRQRKADIAKSEFMALASHQLRTPLTILKWSCTRLAKSLEGQITVNQRGLLNEARVAANRMGDTITTMLAISRIEAGTVHVERTELKLGGTLNEIRAEFRTAYELKRQQVSLDCPTNLHIHTDEHILNEVIGNLLINAIKYTPEGGHIALRAQRVGDRIVVEVEDDGFGIPKQQQHKIFQKFFRGDNVVGEDTEGSGLGLYLVHLLVTRMLHGTIGFHSEEGRGTTFTLSFPA